MDWYEDEFYPLVEQAIEESFNGRYLFNCYLYLKHNKATKPQVRKFCESSTAAELSATTLELEQYIKEGIKPYVKLGHIPKPTARKIKTYLYRILEDAWKYELERKPEGNQNPKPKEEKSPLNKGDEFMLRRRLGKEPEPDNTTIVLNGGKAHGHGSCTYPVYIDYYRWDSYWIYSWVVCKQLLLELRRSDFR